MLSLLRRERDSSSFGDHMSNRNWYRRQTNRNGRPFFRTLGVVKRQENMKLRSRSKYSTTLTVILTNAWFCFLTASQVVGISHLYRLFYICVRCLFVLLCLKGVQMKKSSSRRCFFDRRKRREKRKTHVFY